MSTISTSGDYGYGQDTHSWVFPAIFGALCLVAGIALLFNIEAAVATLVLVAAFSLIITGIGEVVLASERSAADWVVGGALTVGGIMALVWPSMTLWALAVVAGLSLLVAGAVRIAMSMAGRHTGGGWGWKLAGGIATVVAGVMALVWPGATVLVLALILGIRLVVLGIVSLVTARELHAAA